MSLKVHKDRFKWMKDVLNEHAVQNWQDISEILSSITAREKQLSFADVDPHLNTGTAFLTFDFGIDGVSIEISKYAKSFEQIYSSSGECVIHMIAGHYYAQADHVLQPEWRRQKIDGINGWQKWDQGQWFSALYEQPMPDGSEISNQVAQEIFRQAVSIAERLGNYMVENEIVLLIPVNIASNPGNLALSLALVLITEALETFVINSNHDFYWEGGKPPSEREPGEEPGIRDHFFKNIDNKPFFDLFKRLYPWNGERWLQVNINRLQSKTLVNQFGFPKSKVFKLSTSVSNKFFAPFDKEDVINARVRMGYILSDGQETLKSLKIDDHLQNLGKWMAEQRPILLGAFEGTTVDPMSDGLLILLQPTRVIARKRIQKDVALMGELLSNSQLKAAFEKDPSMQLLLQITGPTPREHQADLERVLLAYKEMVAALPKTLADSVFLAFSVGNENHPSFKEKGIEPLDVESIYQIADAVLLPSQTEGRGLPIIEASARQIPIICSRYQPHQVFDGVIGENLSEELRIKPIIFPEGKLNQDFVDQVADMLINKEKHEDQLAHNKTAVRNRYSQKVLKGSFENFIKVFRKM